MNNKNDKLQYLKNYTYPLASYLILVVLIIFLSTISNWGLVLSLAATYMLVVPFILGRDEDIFSFKWHGFVKGVVISVVILFLYVLAYYYYTLLAGSELGIREFSYTFIMVQFLMVALPEEVFFRGYLQKEFGNNITSVVIVSLLFAAAHLVTICISGGAGFGTCAQNGLTFFPSLVMGYLYLRTGTIWSSVFFHFFANLVHILLIIR